MRLVDAVKLLKQMKELRKKRDEEANMTGNRAVGVTWDDAVNFIKNAPTIDPVKHGHWTSSQGLAEVGEVQCDNCKTIYYGGDLYLVGETDENGVGQALMPNYCPHCGAKMTLD